MKNGMGGETHALYFIDNCTRAHFVYHLLRRKERYILPAFQHLVNHIKRRWNFTVKVLHGDGETATSIGNRFQEWITECGFLIEKSPPYT